MTRPPFATTGRSLVAKTKPKGGRPRIPIGPKELARIEQLAGYGLTEAQIAYSLDMDPRTFRRNKAISEQVLTALARGKSKAEAIVGHALFVRAKAGDVSAIRWWEMTRAGRGERRGLVDYSDSPVVTTLTILKPPFLDAQVLESELSTEGQ